VKSFQFCPVCGSSLEHRQVDHKERQVCSSCDYVYYRNPAPAAGVILVENDEVLMVRRKFEPKRGMWSLPAGFLESDEDVEECAVRETKEETNLDIEIVRLLNAYSAFDDPRTAVVLLIYIGKRVGGEVRPGDDASETAFFHLDRLPEDIAFESHKNALKDYKSNMQ